MPRNARIAPQEFVYHILTRGNNKQDVFQDDEDFRKYIDILKKYKEKYLFKLYHYVLMTNHVHLVMETTEAGGELAKPFLFRRFLPSKTFCTAVVKLS